VIKQLCVFILIGFFSINSYSEIIVKDGSIDVIGASSVTTDKLKIYGGIAGATQPITGASNVTINTCVLNTSAPLRACNQNSVHSSLRFAVTFQVTKDIPSRSAKMMWGATDLVTTTVTSATANSTTITLETTWSAICVAAGMANDCTDTSSVFLQQSLKFGVDGDGNGGIEDAEYKSLQLYLHYLAPTDTTNSQLYCTGSPSGFGICNIAFIPGDEKAFIDSALYAGNDTSTGDLKWDAIAIFPVLATGNNLLTMTSFLPSQATPVFKTFNADDGTIPDSAVTGSNIVNTVEYCFIYGTRNLAGNIYRFVNDANAAATACVTPSEVVGILEDKSCFISTAAFGSDMAPEVQTFREFRNKFLLTNTFGKWFVHKYYAYSPPMADMIANSEVLKTITRGVLYPVLGFAKLALAIGFWLSLSAVFAALVGLFMVLKDGRSQSAVVVLFILFVSPNIKAADDRAGQTVIQHEGSKEGLVKILADGTYVYDVKRDLKTESSKITFGMAFQPVITIDIQLGTGSTTTYVFEDFYQESAGVIIGYDYENYFSKENGKLGYQIGASAMFVSGNGILVSTGQPSAEKFSFITMPINAGAIYRFEYKDKQVLAPYVSGGGTLLALIEKREDVAKPNVAAGFGFYGSGGLLINASLLEPDSSFQLESEYGISNLWLALEFRITEVDNDAFSFSNQYVNAGLSFDF
jgi:hypothetical protein